MSYQIHNLLPKMLSRKLLEFWSQLNLNDNLPSNSTFVTLTTNPSGWKHPQTSWLTVMALLEITYREQVDVFEMHLATGFRLCQVHWFWKCTGSIIKGYNVGTSACVSTPTTIKIRD